MSDATDLKDGNTKFLAAYLFVLGLAVAWILLGVPTSRVSVTEVATADWPKAGAALLAFVLVTALGRIASDHLKASVVFWRWRDPLPGSRAFSVFAHRDTRVDIGRLAAAVGGTLPATPVEQNRTWFRLYRGCAADTAVMATHREYLLLRDLSWLTVIIGVLGPLLILVLGHRASASGTYFGVAAALYLIFSFAARNAGERFVKTVLATVSARAEPNRPTLITT